MEGRQAPAQGKSVCTKERGGDGPNDSQYPGPVHILCTGIPLLVPVSPPHYVGSDGGIGVVWGVGVVQSKSEVVQASHGGPDRGCGADYIRFR